MTLLAGFDALLARWSGQRDLVVGAPIANRHRQEVEGLIGFFTNTLALRLDLAGDPAFAEAADRARAATLTAQAHQELPFERLVEELAPERDLARTPLFQVMLVVQHDPAAGLALPGLATELIDVELGTAKFDLTLFLIAERTAAGSRRGTSSSTAASSTSRPGALPGALPHPARRGGRRSGRPPLGAAAAHRPRAAGADRLDGAARAPPGGALPPRAGGGAGGAAAGRRRRGLRRREPHLRRADAALGRARRPPARRGGGAGRAGRALPRALARHDGRRARRAARRRRLRAARSHLSRRRGCG